MQIKAKWKGREGMGLTWKERIMNEQKSWNIKKELEDVRQSDSHKCMCMFFDILEHIEKQIDVSDKIIKTYSDVFSLIEENNLNISSFIQPYDYNTYKAYMLDERVIIEPYIGKKEEVQYDWRTDEGRMKTLDILDEIWKKRKEMKKRR